MSTQAIRQLLPSASDDTVRTVAYLHSYTIAVAIVDLTDDQCSACNLHSVMSRGVRLAGRNARFVMASAG